MNMIFGMICTIMTLTLVGVSLQEDVIKDSKRTECTDSTFVVSYGPNKTTFSLETSGKDLLGDFLTSGDARLFHNTMIRRIIPSINTNNSLVIVESEENGERRVKLEEPDFEGTKNKNFKFCVRPSSMKLLVPIDIDPKHQDQFGFTPLHWAARVGDFQTAKDQVERGADIRLTVPLEEERTAVSFAASAGSKDIVKLLAEKGADVNHKAMFGITPLMEAAEEGHLPAVKQLLELGAEVDAASTSLNETALFIAAKKGRAEVVKLLAERGADVNHKNAFGHTPIVEAFVYDADFATAKALLESGADLRATDGQNETALTAAARSGKTEVVKLLLEKGADVNHTDIFNSSSLNKAAAEGHFSTVQVLMSHGADVNKADTKGETALTEAARRGSADIVKLLAAKGADVHHKSVVGKQAITEAALVGSLPTVKELVSLGANINATDSSGNNALHLALAHRHQEVADYLKSAGIDTNAKNNDGQTPEQYAESYVPPTYIL